MSITFSRASTAFTNDYYEKQVDSPVTEPLYHSLFSFLDEQPLSSPYDDTTQRYTYAETIAKMQSLAAVYPSSISYSNLGNGYNAGEMGGLSVNDDGAKPVWGVSAGMHGDETFAIRALLDFVERFLTESDYVLQQARAQLSLLIIAPMNPGGMVDNTRNNRRGVNLNRNAIPFFDVAPDSDKGASANSEPELQNALAFLNTDNRVSRVISWIDMHGWSSKNDWGFNSHQRYRSSKSQRNLEAQYQYVDRLMKKRTFPATQTVNNPSLITLRNGRAKMKPYLKDRIAQLSRADANCIVFEYPENHLAYEKYDPTKPLGENEGLANTIHLDLFKGTVMAALDMLRPEVTGYMISPSYPAPLNQNSLLHDFNQSQEEPSFMNFNGVTQQHFANGEGGDTRPFVRLTRPDDAAWPVQRARMAYTLVYNNEPTDHFFMGGGFDGSNTLQAAYSMGLDVGENPVFAGNFPIALSEAAMTNDGDTIWLSGGFENGNYHAEIYTADARDPQSSGWTLWRTMTTAPFSNGIQRHTIHHWNDGASDWLIVVGGRDSVGYTDVVLKIKVSDKSESVLANLTTARGWHTAAIYNDTLFVFGGWDESVALDSVEKVNLNTGAVSAGTSLPAIRRHQALAQNGSIAYLCFGSSGLTTRDNIYQYDMSSDTVSEINYDLDGDFDEHGDFIPIETPLLRRSGAFYNPLDEILRIVAGEDENGVMRDQVYEYDFEENTLFLRKTANNRFGKMRTSVKFDSDDGVAVGKSYVGVTTVRTKFKDATGSREPYTRHSAKIGPITALNRNLRQGYTIPSEGEYQSFCFPFTMQALSLSTVPNFIDEEEFRTEVRLYGDTTEIDVATLQIVEGAAAGAPIPLSGKAEDRLTEVFNRKITSYAGSPYRSVRGAFSPLFGSQMPVNQVILDFQCSGALVQLLLRFVATENYTNGSQVVGSVYEYPSTGHFELHWVNGGVAGSESFWSDIQLNYHRITRSWRQNQVEWQLEGGASGITFSLDYYSRLYQRSFSGESVVTGHTANGTAVVYSESQVIAPKGKDWFHKPNQSGLSSAQIEKV